MMRKTSLLFLGALAGVLATLMITQPRALLVGSAARAAEPASKACGCVSISVTNTPASAPRKSSEVLRIIREPFRLR